MPRLEVTLMERKQSSLWKVPPSGCTAQEQPRHSSGTGISSPHLVPTTEANTTLASEIKFLSGWSIPFGAAANASDTGGAMKKRVTRPSIPVTLTFPEVAVEVSKLSNNKPSDHVLFDVSRYIMSNDKDMVEEKAAHVPCLQNFYFLCRPSVAPGSTALFSGWFVCRFLESGACMQSTGIISLDTGAGKNFLHRHLKTCRKRTVCQAH